MELQETLRDIKTQFRLGMNGAVAHSMRQKGVDYKVNFGIELPRLRDIAARYPKDHRVAQALWKEPIRESKIMAILLQPIESFIPEVCDIWMEEMDHTEIGEIACLYLFQHLPYASEKAFQWIAAVGECALGCGYLLLARFFARQMTLSERSESEFLDQAGVAVQSESPFVSRTAFTALRRYAQLGTEQTAKALALVAPLKSHYEALKEEMGTAF